MQERKWYVPQCGSRVKHGEGKSTLDRQRKGVLTVPLVMYRLQRLRNGAGIKISLEIRTQRLLWLDALSIW